MTTLLARTYQTGQEQQVLSQIVRRDLASQQAERQRLPQLGTPPAVVGP